MLSNVLQKLSSIDHLPSLHVLVASIRDDNSDGITVGGTADQLTKLILRDPTLTIEFMKLANSEAYSFRGKLASLSHALLVLDDDLIRLIVSQHPVLPELKEFSATTRGALVKLVKHTIETGVTVEKLYAAAPNKEFLADCPLEELQTAAALHDIGLYFVLSYFPERYDEIRAQSPTGAVSAHSYQPTARFPDHCLLSSVLCQRWHLPDSTIAMIAFHHYPWSSARKDLQGAELLYIADSLSPTYYEIFHESDDTYSMDEHIIMKKNLLDIIERYGLDMLDIARVRAAATVQCAEIFRQLGM